jgi:integrase
VAIEALIPINRRGVKPGRNREVISGILHMLKFGCRWRDCPEICAYLRERRAALCTAYAAGLRASEVTSIKTAGIDSGRMVIRVQQGKGSRDRYVMLSPQLLDILRASWRMVRPAHGCSPATTASSRSIPPR